MNWDMLGHEWAVDLLKEHVAQKRLRHAYLITGPQGVGRRTLALRLAQAVNCLEPPSPGEPCLACRSCRQIENMKHPDLSVVQADQIGGVLKVDQVRELQRSLSLSPYEARYRVALLLRFEEANQSAANALLKTLEEPPDQVILVLTAESSEILLPTIVSRCEVLRLRPLPLEQVSQGLEQRWGMPADQSELLAHISAGRPGYALFLHQDPQYSSQRESWLNDLLQLIGMKRVGRFAYAEELAKDKERMREVLKVWISLWRDVLMRAAGSVSPLANLDRSTEIQNLAEQFSLEETRDTISALKRTLELLDRNVNARLAAEVLMLKLPKGQPV